MAFYQTGGTAITYSWVDVIGNTLNTAKLFDATHFFITDSDANFTEVFGTGFTYNAGAVTGGTITGMERVVGSTTNGELVSFFSLDAATFWADTASQKFAAVFNGSDVFTLSQTQLIGSQGAYAIDGYGGGGTKTLSEADLTNDELFFVVSSGTSETLEDFSSTSFTSTFIQLSNINHFVGGSGTNIADYSHLTSGVVATIQGGAGTVNMGVNGTDQLTNIQILIGTTGSDVFYVDSGLNSRGGGGFDYLIELTAGVNLSYNTNFSGISEFVSNVGNNTVDFSDDADFAYLYGSTGNDTLTLGFGGGYVFGEGGSSNYIYGGSNATNLLVGGSGGSDLMFGGTGTASNFYYVDGNDQVYGAGAFNVVIELVAGVSAQLGSAEYMDVQEFVADGGTNVVTVVGTAFSYLYGGAGNDTLSTGSGGGYLFGEGGTNTLTGGGGLNVFVADGASGINTMNGGSGSNIYYIDANSAVHGAGTFNNVIELQQNASLTLNSLQIGTDVQQVILNGGTNSVDFHAAASTVYLYGGSGNDTLFGGTGNDFLYGGTGTNTFTFAAGWGQDTIEDWTAGTNSIIDLTGLSSLGVHSITDLTQTITSGNDVITSSHTGTNSITLLGVGSALTVGSFHFA
jgi:hypothetical protein